MKKMISLMAFAIVGLATKSVLADDDGKNRGIGFELTKILSIFGSPGKQPDEDEGRKNDGIPKSVGDTDRTTDNKNLIINGPSGEEDDDFVSRIEEEMKDQRCFELSVEGIHDEECDTEPSNDTAIKSVRISSINGHSEMTEKSLSVMNSLIARGFSWRSTYIHDLEENNGFGSGAENAWKVEILIADSNTVDGWGSTFEEAADNALASLQMVPVDLHN